MILLRLRIKCLLAFVFAYHKDKILFLQRIGRGSPFAYIKPEVVDECLELQLAGECRLIKKGLNSEILNERLGTWNKDKTKLIYK